VVNSVLEQTFRKSLIKSRRFFLFRQRFSFLGRKKKVDEKESGQQRPKGNLFIKG